MNPIFVSLSCLAVLALGCASVLGDQQQVSSGTTATTTTAAATTTTGRFSAKQIGEEMQLINKSLEGLLSELALIKREATGRLSSVKNRVSTTGSSGSGLDLERIRQTKVSRFVLKRVAELESESLGMRDEMVKLLELQQQQIGATSSAAGAAPSAQSAPSDPQASSSAPAATTLKPDEEAAAIGFDLEALKKLGDQIESEIEARQAQNPETIRGVHEQLIKLIDNMVQNYLGNMRRSIQRFNNFIGRGRNANLSQQQPRSDALEPSSPTPPMGQSVIDQLQDLGKQFRDFTMLWARTVGKQQSPLIDRIPPRGVELWRDFWDTVRKQVRRINQEFVQISRDMGRLISGRLTANSNQLTTNPSRQQPGQGLLSLLYSSGSGSLETNQVDMKLAEKFHEFYDKLGATLSKEQEKMESMLARQQQAGHLLATTDSQQQQNLDKASALTATNSNGMNQQDSLFDELDDEATRDELNRNVALRQQIQQEINVFGSIFDIMRAFIQRLRDSASVFRDVIQPGAPNNNDSVTPGPSIKPTVDQLLEDTINGQRNINGQAKPVLLPNKRPRQQ